MSVKVTFTVALNVLKSSFKAVAYLNTLKGNIKFLRNAYRK